MTHHLIFDISDVSILLSSLIVFSTLSVSIVVKYPSLRHISICVSTSRREPLLIERNCR